MNQYMISEQPEVKIIRKLRFKKPVIFKRSNLVQSIQSNPSNSCESNTSLNPPLLHTKKRYAVELFLIVAFLTLAVLLIRHASPEILQVAKSGDIDIMEDYINRHGTFGKYLIVFLQIIETVSIILPAIPVYICAGVFFGKLKGFALCYFLNLLLNLIIFITARNVNTFTKRLLNSPKYANIDQLIQSAKHLDRVVIAMCLIPIVPNGMIPYISAQTNIPLSQFLKALAIGSCPAIFLYVFCGDLLISESYGFLLIIIAIIALAAMMFVIFRKKITVWILPKIKTFIQG